MSFRDDFRTGSLDRSVWLPHYLPAWSSRAQTAASYELTADGLRLRIPTDGGLWCADEHDTPLRVSGIQSGNHSGPVGSTTGQQRFRNDLGVREHQPRFEGWLPTPDYPMQIMIAFFDFPEWSAGGNDHLVPELVVDWIEGDQRAARRDARRR